MQNETTFDGLAGYIPLEYEENSSVLEILSKVTSTDGTCRSSLQTEHISESKWISIPESFTILDNGKSATIFPGILGEIYVRDWTVLPSLRFLLQKSLLQVVLVVECKFLGHYLKEDNVLESTITQSQRMGNSLPSLRLELVFTEELLQFVPSDSISRLKSKEKHLIQKLILTLRSYPLFEYPEHLCSIIRGPKGAVNLSHFDENSFTLRDRVFNAIKPLDWNRKSSDPHDLKCSLYGYQQKALSWMKYRESVDLLSQHSDSSSIKSKNPPSIRNIPIILRNRIIYFDYYMGTFHESPIAQKNINGGILCDEMGLGKTVEVLALILASRVEESNHRSNGSFAPHYLRGGTLVVVPPALLQQWASEISNHAGGSLKVEVYNGIRHELEREGKRNQPEVDVSLVEIRKRAHLMFPGYSNSHRVSVSEEMIREAHFSVLRALGEPLPTEDPTDLVLKEARRLAVADIVLTSFDVLKNEIHYDSSKNERTLRNAKRYLIPDCALLKVDFFRMVVDEAQMIGSFSQVGQMTDKIISRNRWCVTGTPMISSNELADLKSLLSFLGLADRSFDDAWQRVVAPGLRPGSNLATKHSSWTILSKILISVMWRTDKAIAKTEFGLPPRSLHFVPLTFQSGEAELYFQLVEKARLAHDAFQSTELWLKTHGDEEGVKKIDKKKLGRLRDEEMASLLQLRLACIHPQLTKFWRQEMSSDLQLGSGGTASMIEVLQRLVDKEQRELQEAERLLCAHLNTLAMRLCDKAESDGRRCRRDRENGASSGNLAITSKVLLEESRGMLLKSRNITEKGIRASEMDPKEASKLPEPEASIASSWSAWKRIQINTCNQMIRVLTSLDEREEKERYVSEKANRISDYIGSAKADLENAELHFSRLEEKRKIKKSEILGIAGNCANEIQFDSWGTIKNPLRWWKSFEEDFDHKKLSEIQLLESQGSTTETSLGTTVICYLNEIEKQIRYDMIPLDSWAIQMKIQSAIYELEVIMQTLDSVDWSTELKSRVPLRVSRYMLGDMVSLLSPFKRDTVLNQFSQILPVPREVKWSGKDSNVIEKVLLEESLGYSKPIDSEDISILEAVAQNQSFIPSKEWKGRVRGYAYYKGNKGLGYHSDVSGVTCTNDYHMRYLMVQCSSKILLELKQRLKTVSKNISSANEKLFKSCPHSACESRLSMTSKIIEYLRILRDCHTASANVRLKASIVNDIEEDLVKAASEYPIKHIRQTEKIRKKIESYRGQAYGSHHKKAFMLSRLKDSHSSPADHIQSKSEQIKFSERYGPGQADESTGIECPVCLSDAIQDMCLWSSCGHMFCIECNDRLFHGTKSAICPVCRMKCSYRYVLRVAAQKKRGDSQIGKELDPTASDDPMLASILVKSDWSIKITALIRRIIALKVSAPDEKSLVFSQFTDALKVVSLALKTHEIPHVHLYGNSKDSGSAIKLFREDETIKVFLIGKKAGAQGLTLVRANHVFLLEPAIDPAIEQQAISRIHRIGQQRDVHIMRLVVKNTIEERILSLQEMRQKLFSEADKSDHAPTTTLPTHANKNETLEKHEIDSLFDCLLHEN